VTFGGQDWQQVPGAAQQMFDVFLIMRQIHEMLWYLTEALTLQPACSIHGELSTTIARPSNPLVHLKTAISMQ
jgi:hypothetical protein